MAALNSAYSIVGQEREPGITRYHLVFLEFSMYVTEFNHEVVNSFQQRPFGQKVLFRSKEFQNKHARLCDVISNERMKI